MLELNAYVLHLAYTRTAHGAPPQGQIKLKLLHGSQGGGFDHGRFMRFALVAELNFEGVARAPPPTADAGQVPKGAERD